ncbi:hypothetical protein FRC09_005017 [Ceratobasidium sp. 395]|nr:hypothetical protein FRC09_005017 [Ceratobasidium sp. 395]
MMHADSPPPTTSGNSHYERHPNITDSVVFSTADEIRARFRLSARAAPPPSASSSAFVQHAPASKSNALIEIAQPEPNERESDRNDGLPIVSASFATPMLFLVTHLVRRSAAGV